jgi:hypothetical protein
LKRIGVLLLVMILAVTLGATGAFAAVSDTEDGDTCGPAIPAGRVYLIDNSADKIDANPAVVADPTGLDLRLHYYESDTEIRVFNEQQNVYVANLAYDGGTYTGYVDSHIIHQEPTLGEPGVPTPTPYADGMRGRGCIEFATPIIGIMITDAQLDASDSVVGLATVTYPTGRALRGLEMGSGRNYQDLVEVDGNTIKIDLQSVEVMDQIRVLTEPSQGVDIDIKPGSDPNCFNNDGKGAIPVAILGSASFDVTQIDPSTVSLEGLAVKMVGKANKLLAHLEDVNGDGFDDLVVQIQDQDGAFAPGSSTATVTGNLYDGTPFEGSDSICVVPEK